MSLLRYAVVPLMFSIWACSSDSNKTNSTSDGVLVGPAGGTVMADGVQVVIPPGALDHDVRITAADEDFVDKLVPPGEHSGKGFRDPQYPVMGRLRFD